MELPIKGVGGYTDWVLECKLGRTRCINLSLASMGYQVRGQGVLFCAVPRSRTRPRMWAAVHAPHPRTLPSCSCLPPPTGRSA